MKLNGTTTRGTGIGCVTLNEPLFINDFHDNKDEKDDKTKYDTIKMSLNCFIKIIQIIQNLKEFSNRQWKKLF